MGKRYSGSREKKKKSEENEWEKGAEMKSVFHPFLKPKWEESESDSKHFFLKKRVGFLFPFLWWEEGPGPVFVISGQTPQTDERKGGPT